MSDTHFIYKITNNATGKIYIGRTINPARRWYMHLRAPTHYYIHNAIRAYGKDSFTFDVIETVDNSEMAALREMYYIALFKTNINRYGKECGYNMTDGGEGESGPRKPLTEEHKAKISSALFEWYRNNEAHNLGKPLSEEHKAAISAALLGEKHWAYNKTPNANARNNRNVARDKSTRKRSYEASDELRKMLSDNMDRIDFTPYSIEIRNRVAEMHASCKYTYKDIAEELNITINSVQSLLRKVGKAIYPNRITEDIKSRVIQLRETTNLKRPKIAEMTGVSVQTVEYILKDHKMKLIAKTIDANTKLAIVNDRVVNKLNGKTLAGKYGIHVYVIMEILREAGINFAKPRKDDT